MIEVYICKLPEEKSKAIVEKILPNVSIEKQNRINRFFHIDDVYRTLLGDLLVRFILCKRYSLVKKGLTFDKNLYGKPFVSQYPHFHYNISHSGEWVVCAVHEKEIGVDIEKVLPFDLKIAKGLFTEEEYKNLLNEKEERVSSFYDIWTLKESYIKAVGKGMSIPLDSFSVKKLNANTITLTDIENNTQITNFNCKQYYINDDYKLSVCAQGAHIQKFKEEPILVSFKTLCTKLGISY